MFCDVPRALRSRCVLAVCSRAFLNNLIIQTTQALGAYTFEFYRPADAVLSITIDDPQEEDFSVLSDTFVGTVFAST